MNHPIGQTKLGAEVYVDLIHSKAAKHIAELPYITEIFKEVLKTASIQGAAITIEHNLGRPIGYDFVIPTTEKDSVFYAKKSKENTYTRFVKNNNPTATAFLSALLRKDEHDNFELLDIWIGRVSPVTPDSEFAAKDSKAFWETHAVVFANQSVQSQTVTKTSPYFLEA